MNIIVLAGGLSPERDVSLSSGASICRTLRERGHKAFLLDVFFGLEYDKERLQEVFGLPDAGLAIADSIKTTAPDLKAGPERHRALPYGRHHFYGSSRFYR